MALYHLSVVLQMWLDRGINRGTSQEYNACNYVRVNEGPG